ncbi:hypothetical protein AB4Y45_27930 [Paraburkholderia sp. EG287A]|uniref:hypothetical protein n=1 Tax=Paraburkholderia sp. EG287A TaxID=3237012 RepID=UPI0034D33912
MSEAVHYVHTTTDIIDGFALGTYADAKLSGVILEDALLIASWDESEDAQRFALCTAIFNHSKHAYRPGGR